METRCSEGSPHGDKVTLSFYMAGLFVVDALAVFMDEAHDAESADTVAQWLETMAAKVREKFNPSNA